MPSRDRILDWYSDDEVWHERVLIWKGSSPNGHPHAGLGPVRTGLGGGRATQVPDQRLSGKVLLPAPPARYRFPRDLTQEEMKNYIEMEMALDEMGISEISGDGRRPANVKISKHMAFCQPVCDSRQCGTRRGKDHCFRRVLAGPRH